MKTLLRKGSEKPIAVLETNLSLVALQLEGGRGHSIATSIGGVTIGGGGGAIVLPRQLVALQLGGRGHSIATSIVLPRQLPRKRATSILAPMFCFSIYFVVALQARSCFSICTSKLFVRTPRIPYYGSGWL